jgi:hypothetical protein
MPARPPLIIQRAGNLSASAPTNGDSSALTRPSEAIASCSELTCVCRSAAQPSMNSEKALIGRPLDTACATMQTATMFQP